MQLFNYNYYCFHCHHIVYVVSILMGFIAFWTWKLSYLSFISTCDANNKFIIFSDSLSVLKAMNHTSSKKPQIQKLLEKCHEPLANKEIVLCWIPSHIGIQGNEMVDQPAKTSLSLEPTSFKIPFSNFKPSINRMANFME